MNIWSLTNLWYGRWKVAVAMIRQSRSESENYCKQAAIAQKEYVCYLAQEWAGARK